MRKVLTILNRIKKSGISFEFELTDNLNIPDASGQNSFDSKEIRSLIKIRPNAKNETVISHELLHSYFFSKRFPRVKPPVVEHQLLSTLGERISNSLFHKLIQDKQAKLSIDTSKLNIEYLEGLYADNFEDNGSFIKAFPFSLIIFEGMLSCSKEWNEYEKLIKEKFLKSYDYAKLLYDSAMLYPYETAREYRKAFIRVMSKCTEIFIENNFGEIPFNQLIPIDYIPTEAEYEFLVKEIFIEKEFPDSDGLKYSFFSKEDNQLSFILTINSKDDLEKILSFKLKKFYELNDRHLLL